jgi:hypothetical protein
MSKTLISPSAKWAGSIQVPEYLTLPQWIAWKDAFAEAKQYAEDNGDGHYTITDPSRFNLAMLEVCCKIVEKWELAGLGDLTAETFPGTPPMDALVLQRFVVDAIATLVSGEETIPKAS